MTHWMPACGPCPSPRIQSDLVVELGQYQAAACGIEKQDLELSVGQLTEMEAQEAVLVVDVREGWEREIVAIPHSQHVPLAQLHEGELRQLARSASKIVFVCKTGARSYQAAQNFASGPTSSIPGLQPQRRNPGMG